MSRLLSLARVYRAPVSQANEAVLRVPKPLILTWHSCKGSPIEALVFGQAPFVEVEFMVRAHCAA